MTKRMHYTEMTQKVRENIRQHGLEWLLQMTDAEWMMFAEDVGIIRATQKRCRPGPTEVPRAEEHEK